MLPPDCQLPAVCTPVCMSSGSCQWVGPNVTDTQCFCTGGYGGDQCEIPPTYSEGSAVASSPMEFPLPLWAILAIGGGACCLLVLLVAGAIVALCTAGKKEHRRRVVPVERKLADFARLVSAELVAPPGKVVAASAELENLLVNDPELRVVGQLADATQITEAEPVARALVVLFEAHGRTDALLQYFLRAELADADSQHTLFRSNSMGSKMFKFYSRLIALPYLYATIAPEICEIVEEDVGLEVDPEKLEEGTDVDEMRWLLIAQSQKILKQILNSADACPQQLVMFFRDVRQAIEQSDLADEVDVSVALGGFVFLRFFCPAVSSPEAYGIIPEPPSARSRRLLILITKVLQNLSNKVEFGSKEPYMEKMNDFIVSNIKSLDAFYPLLVDPAHKRPARPIDLPRDAKKTALAIIVQQLRECIDSFEDEEVKAQVQHML